MQIHRIRPLRRLLLPVLRSVGVDVAIRHHWTGDRLLLHLFKHKGYWYHGRRREHSTMMLFAELLKSGDFVIEIGGHIGYVSLYLASLIGPDGRLIVFEPAPNNLRYIRQNTATKPAISVVEEAITDFTGRADLHVEDLTGQNNSLLSDYDMLDKNEEWAFAGSNKHRVSVACITLDDFLARERLPPPNFAKIDVEGAEHSVLTGMQATLQCGNVALMVEVTKNPAEVFGLLTDAGYRIFRPDYLPVLSAKRARGNLFCLKATDPRIALFEPA